MEENTNELQKLVDGLLALKAENHISDDDFKQLIGKVRSIVESSETKEEVIEKLEALLPDGDL